MAVRILCSGDIHIGRRPTRLPEEADSDQHSAAAAWRRLAQAALDASVDAVLLSGDVIDEENSRFAAFNVLEEGFASLREAGVPVIAVAGNHDHNLLARLARSGGAGGFRLLGADGRWERFVLERDGEPVLQVLGRSFTNRHSEGDPLADFNAEIDRSLPAVGLLHADLDAGASLYAPVSAQALWEVPVDAWVLGHVHSARQLLREDGSIIFYTGSPQPLDPGETGWHGAWLLELEPGRQPRLQPQPIATVRYDEVEIDVTGAESVEAVESAILSELAARARSIRAESGNVACWCCRLLVTGRTPLAGRPELANLAQPLQESPQHIESLLVAIDRVRFQTAPPLDIDSLAQQRNALGLLASWLSALQTGETPADLDEALKEAAAELEGLYALSYYQPLGYGGKAVAPPGGEALRKRLLERGMALLSALAAQKEGAR